MSFSYSAYADLLATIASAGYSASVNWKDPPREKTILLRHDIDVLPELCLPLSKVEEESGFTSSWFFLEHNGLYCLHDSITQNVIEELLLSNHEIGLHFDAASSCSRKKLSVAIDVAISNWVKLFGREPTVFSFHRPTAFELLPGDISFRWHQRVSCTYDGLFFFGAKYISDSNRKPIDEVRFKAILEEGKPVQLLTHPLWWAERELGTSLVRERVLSMLTSRCDAVLKENIRVFGGIK